MLLYGFYVCAGLALDLSALGGYRRSENVQVLPAIVSNVGKHLVRIHSLLCTSRSPEFNFSSFEYPNRMQCVAKIVNFFSQERITHVT